MLRMRQTKSFDPGQLQNFRSDISYVIEKNLANLDVIYKDRIGRDDYSYPEKINFNWKILPETIKIGEYNTQKAETEYGGRNWTAWFSSDIPLPDGPYKFCGLPGLIIKIQDEKGDYSFDLIQVRKIPEMPVLQQRGTEITLTKDKFQKTKAAFQKDPEAFMQANRNNSGRTPGAGFGANISGGNTPDPNQRKEMRERMLNEIKSDNNPLELK